MFLPKHMLIIQVSTNTRTRPVTHLTIVSYTFCMFWFVMNEAYMGSIIIGEEAEWEWRSFGFSICEVFNSWHGAIVGVHFNLVWVGQSWVVRIWRRTLSSRRWPMRWTSFPKVPLEMVSPSNEDNYFLWDNKLTRTLTSHRFGGSGRWLWYISAHLTPIHVFAATAKSELPGGGWS